MVDITVVEREKLESDANKGAGAYTDEAAAIVDELPYEPLAVIAELGDGVRGEATGDAEHIEATLEQAAREEFSA